MLSGHWPGPSPGPPHSQPRELSSLSSCRQQQDLKGPLCSGRASQAASTHPSRHRPRYRPWGGPGAGHLAGSPSASRQAEHRGQTPSLPAGWDWASWGQPCQAPLPEPQHLHRPGGLTGWGEGVPEPKESEDKRGQGRCPAPCSHGNLQQSGSEEASMGHFPLFTQRYPRVPSSSSADC